MNQNTKTHTAPRGAACHGNAARRRRSRYGSVLILVVALLVLMALIGTAWISTARVDRAAAVQHGSNTQVDLLVDGVTNMAVARLVADTSEAGKFRHWTGYNHFDDAQYDDFMASRVPVLRDEIAPQWQGGPRYPGDSHPTYFRGRLVRMGGTSGRFYLCRQTHRADPGQQPGGSAYWEEIGTFDNGAPFDSGNPPVWPAVSRILPPDTKFSDIQGGAPDFTDRTGMSTVTKLVNGRYFPAFEFYPEFRRDDAPPAQILAADTDGDGIADANYFKLPVGRLNGLDYYAAIRIVDNNSAVNASTALGNLDPGVAGFPSSINFMTPFNTRRVPAIQGPTAAIVTQQHFDLNRARFN